MTDEELIKRLRAYWGVWDATRVAGKSLTDEAADRIEEMGRALQLVQTDGLHIKHARRADTAEARLTKAVAALQAWKSAGSDDEYYRAVQLRNAALAEIGGGA